MTTRQLRPAVLLLILLVPGRAYGQATVDSRVQRLEETVQLLERRIASLEAQLRGHNAPTQSAPDKVTWRHLKRGMSESEVEQILGSPTKVAESSLAITWQYRYPSALGHIQFDADSRRVESWSEP